MFGHKINFKISVLAFSSNEIATLNFPRKATINAKIMDYILCDFSHRKKMIPSTAFVILCHRDPNQVYDGSGISKILSLKQCASFWFLYYGLQNPRT